MGDYVKCIKAGSTIDCWSCYHSRDHEKIKYDSLDAKFCSQWQDCNDGINSNGKVRCIKTAKKKI